MRCSLCISYVGKTTFSILRHIHYCIHGHYAQLKTFVKSHLVSCPTISFKLIFLFLIFQVSPSFISRTSLVYFNIHQDMLGKQQLKVAQINYVSRSQLHSTANLNFDLICKKVKLCWALSFLFS